MPRSEFVAYAVFDHDTGERYSTTDYTTSKDAQREVDFLKLLNGGELNICVAGITLDGQLKELD